MAGHRPDFAAAAPVHGPQGRSAHLPVPASEVLVHRRARPSAPADAARTETVRLLEEGRIDELAALVGAATGDDQTVGALKQLAAHHNQERSSQTIADARYELGWEKSAITASATRTDRGPGLASHRRRCRNRCTTGRSADDARAPAPDPRDAWIGRRRRAARGRVAHRREPSTPSLRIVHLGGPRLGRRTVGPLVGTDAAPCPQWNAADRPGRTRRWDRGAHLDGHPRRATGNARPTPSHPCSPACGASGAPRPTNIPRYGVGSPTWPRAAPTTGPG